jgi:hypothetical protein
LHPPRTARWSSGFYRGAYLLPTMALLHILHAGVIQQIRTRPAGAGGRHARRALAHRLEPYSPKLIDGEVFSAVQFKDEEHRSVRRVMSFSCSQPFPTKE